MAFGQSQPQPIAKTCAWLAPQQVTTCRILKDPLITSVGGGPGCATLIPVRIQVLTLIHTAAHSG